MTTEATESKIRPQPKHKDIKPPPATKESSKVKPAVSKKPAHNTQ